MLENNFTPIFPLYVDCPLYFKRAKILIALVKILKDNNAVIIFVKQYSGNTHFAMKA
jgi:hypothetical protein